MSLAGGGGTSPGLMSGGGGALPITYPMMYLMFIPPHEQTDACENITFSQLRLLAIKTNFFEIMNDFCPNLRIW